MIIKCLKLPEELVEAIKSKVFQRKEGSWKLKEEIDSYGNLLETELGQLFESEPEIIDATARLSHDFVADGDYGAAGATEHPAAIPDILDFSKIVSFGISGDGAPFCLDYRKSENDPEVIWWDDVYWRKISPSIMEFLALLEFNG